MSRLVKTKINYSRRNAYKLVLDNIEIGGYRDNMTGRLGITINSNPNNGDTQYRLDLSKEEIEKIRWMFVKTETEEQTIPGVGKIKISDD